ncbi:MAG: hypothetical protein OCC49_02025 [Fibrobacterales bacterium]
MADENINSQGLDAAINRQEFKFDIDVERTQLAKKVEHKGEVEEKGYSEEAEQAKSSQPDFNVTISLRAQELAVQNSVGKEESYEVVQKISRNSELSGERNQSFINQADSAQEYIDRVNSLQAENQSATQRDIDLQNESAFNAPGQQDEITYQQSVLESRRNQASRIAESYQLNSRLESNANPEGTPFNQLNFANAQDTYKSGTDETTLAGGTPETGGAPDSQVPENATNLSARIENTERNENDNTLIQQAAGDETGVRRQRQEREERFAPPTNRDTPEEEQVVENKVIQQEESREEVSEVDNEQAETTYLERLRQQSEAIIDRYREGRIFE